MPYGEGVTTAPEPEADPSSARRRRGTAAPASPAPNAPAPSPAVEPASPSTIPVALVDRLAFLHEFAQLATHARDWDELMRTVVDELYNLVPLLHQGDLRLVRSEENWTEFEVRFRLALPADRTATSV